MCGLQDTVSQLRSVNTFWNLRKRQTMPFTLGTAPEAALDSEAQSVVILFAEIFHLR